MLRITAYREFSRLVVVGALGILMAWGMAMASGHDQQERGFCQRGPVKDYLAKLQRVAPLHKIPASRKLPFAPRGVLVYPLAESPLVGRGAVGFGLADEAFNWPRRLNWVVDASLIRVSGEGRALGLVSRKIQRLGTRRLNGDRNFGPRFAVPGAPAYYRVDISFKSVNGDVLGAYGEYFRVMKPRYEMEMTLSDSVVAPGQVLRARLKNLGTEPVLAEKAMTVEKREGPLWVPVATVYDGGRRADGSVFVFGGKAGPCFAYRVPEDVGEGQFRISERLRRYLNEEKGRGRGVGAEFKVIRPNAPE